ncbi:MAG: alpha-L-fucosidase [Acidobacteriia bacterium]|nr:alpha-L-fucosidase [Terriglobia bacterium]
MKFARSVVMLLVISFPAIAQRLPRDLGPAEYYRAPQLTLMIGFIKDPEHRNFTVPEWAKGIGANFNAAWIAERCKRDGVVQIIWYDKWIDGLVFHHTKTTAYHTERDFLAELAPECRKRGIKLVIYFNTYYDGNPEFARWACVDQRGNPIPFSPFWPENLLSLYSPFREKVLEQIRELFVDYHVDGIWLDVPTYAGLTYDRWTREAFRKQFDKEMDEATALERERFWVESSVNWNREVAAFVRKLNPAATVTTNEVIDPISDGPMRAVGMGEPLDYFSTELHTIQLQQKYAPTLAETNKPFEGGTLISDDWFTPLNSGPLKTSKSIDQMHVELTSLFSAGMNVYLAVAPGHDGTLDEGTMQLVDYSGEWLRARRPWLEEAEDLTDVAILLGTADPKELRWPGGPPGYNDELAKLETNLRANGYLPHRLINCAGSRRFDSLPATVRTVIVPDRAQLTSSDAEKLDAFVRRGGKVLAFGRGMGLTGTAEPPQAAPMFGLHSAGYVMPDWVESFAMKWNGQNVSLRGPILGVTATHAEPLMSTSVWTSGEMPLLTRNHVGDGTAYALTATESAVADKPDFLRYLWTETIGEPLWKVQINPQRYLVRIRRQKERYVLHVIDSLTTKEGPMSEVYDTPRYRPLYTKISINSERIPFQKATVVPDQRLFQVSTEGHWKTMEIYANPELIIALE